MFKEYEHDLFVFRMVDQLPDINNQIINELKARSTNNMQIKDSMNLMNTLLKEKEEVEKKRRN